MLVRGEMAEAFSQSGARRRRDGSPRIWGCAASRVASAVLVSLLSVGDGLGLGRVFGLEALEEPPQVISASAEVSDDVASTAAPLVTTMIEPVPEAAGAPVLLDPPGDFFQDGFYERSWVADEPLAVGFPGEWDDLWAPRPWSWQLMPNNLIYTSYLAGPKESRLGTVWYDDTSPSLTEYGLSEGWLWDSTLGGRASILRYGSDTILHPQGFEVQIEGAAFVRLDPEDDRDLRSADYRFGVPLVYGVGRWQSKLAYYHNSAHLGDEFMIKNPTFPRVNYVRDVIVLGTSWYPLDWMRLYGEVGYSFFNAGGSQPWEFQFGTELLQARPTGGHGAPFLAVNSMLRQELDYGGNVCVQAGWFWRGRRSEKLYRIGVEYLYGSDPQYEFVFYNQNRFGVGMWYDF